MKTLKEYDLMLKTLPQGSHTFSYHLDDKFFTAMESDDIKGGSVDAELVVESRVGSYELTFSMSGEVTIECDRCLDDMTHIVEAGYHTFVRYGDEFDDSNDDLIVIPESDNSLNISRMLYDTVVLSIPFRHVHDEGECNEAMSRILEEHSAEASADDNDEIDPRWEALKNFKNIN